MTVREVYFKKVYFSQVLDCKIYIPQHKTWVQLFCEDPMNDIKEIIDIDGVPTDVVKEYAYQMNEVLWDNSWETETEIVDEEETTLTAAQYLEKHFDEVWNM